MLIQFKVSNYRSFKDQEIFSMAASSLSELPENVFKATRKFKLLKSAVVYGHNASGKSNLLGAMRFMRRFVINSSKETQQGEKIDVMPFKLNTDTENKPCSFEIVFFIDGVVYRYGFEIDNTKIHAEWLFSNSQIKNARDANLFIREGQKITVGNQFREGADLTGKTRENALFLSVVAQFNGKIATRIMEWFKNKIHVINDTGVLLGRTLERIQKDNSLLNRIKPFILAADLGINDIKVHIAKESIESLKIPQVIKNKMKQDVGGEEIEVGEIHTLHSKFDKDGIIVGMEEFDLGKMGSEGTKKMFAASVPIIDALQNGEVFVVDEFEMHLHPFLVRFLIKLFNSDLNRNNAQLIFASHNTECLSNECFRRDQIWFIEKTRYGSSKLYSLAEFKIRKDERYDKNYLQGKYGAVPVIKEAVAIYGNANETPK